MGEDLVYDNTFSNNLDGQKWKNHFKILLTKIDCDINNTMKKSDTPINKMLNERFTTGELKHTIKGLKNKKALDPDSIANEFLKLATDDLLKLILDFLNLNLEKGITASKWCFDLISLIHKDGPKYDPNNYSGICIMNTLLKVLCTLLNNKLITYCNNQQLINQEQIGFQKNNRTSDHILTLKAVVNKYVGNKKGKKTIYLFCRFPKGI